MSSLAVLFAGTFGASILAFVIQLALARTIQVSSYGQFSATLAAINIAQPIATFGIPTLWLQAFGREGWIGFRWIPPSFKLIRITLLVGSLAFAGYAICNGARTSGSFVILLVGIPILFGQFSSEFIICRLQLEERFLALATWQVAAQAGRLAAVLLVMLSSEASLIVLLAGYAAVGSLISVLSGLQLRDMQRGHIRLAGHAKQTLFSATMATPTLWETAIHAAPFAAITVFFLLSFQSVVILLDWMVGAQAAGLYQAALLILLSVYMIPQVIYSKYMVGKICRWIEHDKEMFVAAFHLGVLGMAILGLICMVVTMVFSRLALSWIFGPQYAAAASVLTLLSLVIPIHFVQHVYSSLFVSRQDMPRKMRYAGVSALVCVVSNLIFLPIFGLTGAVISALAAETIVLLLSMLGAARFIDGIEIFQTFRPSTVRSSLRVAGWVKKPPIA